MKLYSVYDKQVSAYMPMFPARARGEALRMVTDAATNPEGQFAKHLQDYVLYEIGEFLDDSGRIVQSDDHPVMVCPLAELVKG